MHKCVSLMFLLLFDIVEDEKKRKMKNRQTEKGEAKNEQDAGSVACAVGCIADAWRCVAS